MAKLARSKTHIDDLTEQVAHFEEHGYRIV
jgi:hypothetical protein